MSDLEVAETILLQLGGKRFSTMTGARNFVGDKTSLSFRLPRAKDGVNSVKITLYLALDLYTMEFYRIRGHAFTTVETVNQVFAEDLQKVFTEHTGLYTHL